MAKTSFIEDVKTFQTEKIKNKVMEKCEKTYMSHPDWEFNKVNQSSRAASPLFLWAEAQKKCKKIFIKIKPKQVEILGLNQESQALDKQNLELTTTITEMEKNIAEYRIEYQELIDITNQLEKKKNECDKKINKANSLITGLNSEKVRW